MRIAVCIKQVPDSESRIKISSNYKQIDTTDIKYIISPYDEYAIEEAIRIKERIPDTEVVIVCAGNENVTTTIRNALALGADKAVRINTNDLNFDSHLIASAIAEYLEKEKFDLILFGKQAIDDDNSQVGPRTAEILNLPCVTCISKLELNGGKARVEREVEGGKEIFEVTLPAIFTAEKGLNEPRYASLKGIMAAKKKEIIVFEPSPQASIIEIISIELPPGRPAGRIVGQGIEAVPELVRLLKEEAKLI